MRRATETESGKIVPIVFCADANYGQYLPVAVQSIIENASPNHEYHVIIFDCGIKPADLAVLERQIAQYGNFSLRTENISVLLNEYRAISEKHNWNSAIYGPLLISKICNNYEKIIYADADIIFNRDIAELMAIDLGKNYIAAAADTGMALRWSFREDMRLYAAEVLGLRDNEAYVNSGLLVFNSAAWRIHNLEDKAFQFLSANKTKFPDQDAINIVCKGKIYYLPQYWNCIVHSEETWIKVPEKQKKQKNIQNLYTEWRTAFEKVNNVLHFTGIKPWLSLTVPKGDIWWHYARETEIYDRLLAAALILNQEELMRQNEPISYSFFGLPLFSARCKFGNKKYYLGKMRRHHVAELHSDPQAGYKSVYLFGIKIFSRQISD